MVLSRRGRWRGFWPETMNTETSAPALQAKIVGPQMGALLNVMGTRNEVKLAGADCGGRMSVIEVMAAPGDGIPLHVHTIEDEIFYVIEGEVDFTVDGETTRGGAGTFAFLPVNRPHSWFVRGDRHARLLLLTSPGTFDGFFAELACPPGQGRQMGEVIEICRRYGIEFLKAD